MKNGLIINEHGTKLYYLNDKLHREDGPAVEWIDGYKMWYYNDQYINVKSQKKFEQYLKLLIFS